MTTTLVILLERPFTPLLRERLIQEIVQYLPSSSLVTHPLSLTVNQGEGEGTNHSPIWAPRPLQDLRCWLPAESALPEELWHAQQSQGARSPARWSTSCGGCREAPRRGPASGSAAISTRNRQGGLVNKRLINETKRWQTCPKRERKRRGSVMCLIVRFHMKIFISLSSMLIKKLKFSLFWNFAVHFLTASYRAIVATIRVTYQ